MAFSETTIQFQVNEDGSFPNGITDQLVGFLEGIIVESNEQVSITVMSEYGYLIFKEAQHQGSEYYSPRAHSIAPQRQLSHQFQFDKFFINEQLRIIVSGPKTSKISVKIRIS